MSKIEIPKSCEIECMFIGEKFLICVRSARIKLNFFTDLQITKTNFSCFRSMSSMQKQQKTESTEFALFF
jgi:hypothetical protein